MCYTDNKTESGEGDGSVLLEVIQQNYVGVTIALLLILFIATNNNFDKKTNRLFLAAAVCVLLLIVEEAWEGQLALRDSYTPARVWLSAVGYTLRPLIPFFLVVMARGNARKWAAVMSVPAVLNMAAAFSALFCRAAFWYTADNQFVRGPLGITPFLTAGFYILALLYLAMREHRKGSRKEGMIVSAIALLALVSTLLESVFHLRGIQTAGIGVSITFYYLFLHSNHSNRDPLTGALTRRRFYLDAEKYRTVLTAVISLDLNDLKKLNDRRGHLEGDKALTAVTGLIKKHMGMHASLYRTGGDEFMILCYKMGEERVRELIEAIRRELEQTEYRCAIGYAPYCYRLELDRVCQVADEAMYENKRRMKKTAAGGQPGSPDAERREETCAICAEWTEN